MLNKLRTLLKQIQSPSMPVTVQPEQPLLAYEPELLPPLKLMRQEGLQVLEEWFRWAEEWSMLLRVYGDLGRDSKVMEIGCGLGRIAFALRYILSGSGSYDGFEICREKVEFLERNFHKSHPNFHFIWANLRNDYYNPNGEFKADEYIFPYADNSFDIVYAASVFTHLLPEVATNYLQQAARVLKPEGRCIFSFFLLDNYQAGRKRWNLFEMPIFNFDHNLEQYGSDFAVGVAENPEETTAFRLALIEEMMAKAGLQLAQPPLTGMWSGAKSNWISTQDLLILKKATSTT